jgi:hypothetical protein
MEFINNLTAENKQLKDEQAIWHDTFSSLSKLYSKPKENEHSSEEIIEKTSLKKWLRQFVKYLFQSLFERSETFKSMINLLPMESSVLEEILYLILMKWLGWRDEKDMMNLDATQKQLLDYVETICEPFTSDVFKTENFDKFKSDVLNKYKTMTLNSNKFCDYFDKPLLPLIEKLDLTLKPFVSVIQSLNISDEEQIKLNKIRDENWKQSLIQTENERLIHDLL